MSEDIKKYYKDILPEDVNNEIEYRIRELEINQEEEIKHQKETLPLNFNEVKFI